ncbi:unnamed protein product [Fusarium equiseti]|uniref:Uncharacterized protein n=1 Tax=Fusarium equiseti TaxID=61235 RepID=A0A8J2NB28_FUSEQ|nr:unnamed protein product [Fusarium equiseti]
MSSQSEQLAPISCLITTNDAECHLYGMDDPNDLAGDRDLKAYRKSLSEDGLAPVSDPALRATDFWSGSQALYRTASVDHSIVMEGETECVLDNRSSKNLRGSDIEVQKGSILSRTWGLKLLPKTQKKELELHGFAGLVRLSTV